MQTDNNVIQFPARPSKPAPKPWVGPVQAERERCLAVCLHPAAQGNWASVARVLLCESAWSADAIIERLTAIRAETAAELRAELAAGLFSVPSKTP